MQLLIVVSTPQAGPILVGLIEACRRRGAECGVFFTNDGVKSLGDAAVRTVMRWADRAVVCENSWDRHMEGQNCPVERGSQTDNSLMAGHASKIVSL